MKLDNYFSEFKLWAIASIPATGIVMGIVLLVSGNWINLSYTAWNAKIYCSYQKIQPADLTLLDIECRELLSRNAQKAESIAEQMHDNKDINVYNTLFRIEGETVSPIQFMLTDSSNHFFAAHFLLNVNSISIH